MRVAANRKIGWAVTFCVLLAISVFYTGDATAGEALLRNDANTQIRAGQLMPKGSIDPNYTIETWFPSKTWNGTTLFGNSILGELVEVNMLGEVVWRYKIPGTGNRKIGIMGVMVLPRSNNVLYTVVNPEYMRGVYEVNREGQLVWSFKDRRVSHDAVRLPNGNTLITAAHSEDYSAWPYTDPQVFEVNPRGEVVWTWHAKEVYANSTKYKDVRSRDFGPWTHVNEALRLPDGLTLISPRNFKIVIYVDSEGKPVKEFGDPCVLGCGDRMKLWSPHSPIPLANGNVLISDVRNRVIEFDIGKRQVVWQWPSEGEPSGESPLFVRGAQRLPNGNTLVVDSNGQLIEVTPDGEKVWKLKTSTYVSIFPFDARQASFFQAERVSYMLPTFTMREPTPNRFYSSSKIPLVVTEGIDVGNITYSVLDSSKNIWIMRNETLLENVFKNSLTPPTKRKGPEFLDLPNGEYILRILASSTGFGYKEFVTPKRVNYAIQDIRFFVNKPIMHTFKAGFDVSILSNSTVDNLSFNQPDKLIAFTIEGHSGTQGFSEVAIPLNLLEGPYTVTIDGTTVAHTVSSNTTHASLRFGYAHGVKSVQIHGNTVIPEFPVVALSLVIIIVTFLLLIIRVTRRVNNITPKRPTGVL